MSEAVQIADLEEPEPETAVAAHPTDSGKHDEENGKIQEDAAKETETGGKEGETKEGQEEETETGGKEGETVEGQEGGEEKEEDDEGPFHFDGEHTYKDILFPASVPDNVLDSIINFKFRSDDVLIAGYPKCGVTWVEHATYLLLHSEEGDEALTMSALTQRSGFLEVRVPGVRTPPFVDVAESLPSPRIIRTHLPYSFLKEQLAPAHPKVLVVLRNVKDCLVSYYHFLRNNEDVFGFFGDFNDFFELVREKRLTFGDWFDHTLDWWTQQDSEHVLFLEYEDMVQDIRKEVQNIVDFLELDREDSVIDHVAELSTFEQMSLNPMTQLRAFPFLENDVNRFMRKGIVGDWREHFTDEQNEYIDVIYEKRIKGTGLMFEFGKRKN